MQKTNDDCFYFLTSTCAKGSTCPYRHNPVVLTCNVICPAWSRGNCLDPACSLRHSTIQQPVVSNGTLCYYENTPMGCRKSDCTFSHLRSRPNFRSSSAVRPSTTNLVNKDANKSAIVSNSPSSLTPQPSSESIFAPQITPTSSVTTPTIAEIPPTTLKTETPPTIVKIETPPTVVKTETPPRRIAVPAEKTLTEGTTRNGSVDSSEDTKIQSRVVVNRNVVIAETANNSNRKVVVSSTITNSPKRITNDDDDSDIDLDDLIDQNYDIKKMNSPIDISFPCSAPSITNRLFMSTTKSPPKNGTKPIRLNRDCLPATKITTPTPTNSLLSSSNGEKITAGTGLPQDDERQKSRIERFKKKPISPPRSVVDSSASISTRNVIASKRPAPEQVMNGSLPSKRLSSQQEHNNTTTIGDLCSPPVLKSRRMHERHRPRRRRSSSSSSSSSSSPTPPPLHPTYSSPSSMNDSTWNKEVDKFLAKTAQPKFPLSTISIPPKPVPLLSLRPQYVPPQQMSTPRHPLASRAPQRPRQPTSVTAKRSSAPVIAPSSKPIEHPTPPPPPPPRPLPAAPSPTMSQNEDEILLRDSDEPSDVVDTFALIDEALFEADHLLELM